MAKKQTLNLNPSEEEINDAAIEIEEILKKRGLGMQAVIQIFKVPPQKSPIIMAGNDQTVDIMDASQLSDNDKAMLEALKPIGDEIGK